MSMRIISVLFLALAIGGCNMYRLEIQQGNYITSEQLSQVQAGMSRSQVQNILGTPLMTDDFHKNRWDYVFYQRKGDQITTQQGATIFFNAQDQVVDVRVRQN